MYIKIRLQWTYNDIHNNHSRYTLPKMQDYIGLNLVNYM